MAIHYNVRTVTDGLVLALDAANTKSYPGSGTTWNDLSGNSNNGTLVNGVGYNAANGGSLSFNGSSQYVIINKTGISNFGTFPFSIEMWFYRNPLSGVTILYDSRPEGNGNYLNTYIDSDDKFKVIHTGAIRYSSIQTIQRSSWYNICLVRENTGANQTSIYINGNLDSIYTDSIDYTDARLVIGAGAYTPLGVASLNGFISIVRTYKGKGLTAAEVAQNYYALRSRYIAAPSIPTPTLPNFYEQLTYTASGNLTVTGNGTTSVDIFKTSGSRAWDNQAYSTTAFTAPCTIEFNKQAGSTDNTVSYAMIGWNEDPTANASYNSLDYASYPYATNSYNVHHNGTEVQNGGTWDTANKLYVVYGTDGFIRHYNGSTLLYSANYGTGRTVYVDSSFYAVNSTFGGFSNIKVIRSAWNGSSYA